MSESKNQFAEAFEELTGWELEDYPDQAYADTCWEFWRMSREAIEIELPIPAYSRKDIQAVAMHRVNLCKDSIRSAGIKVKE